MQTRVPFKFFVIVTAFAVAFIAFTPVQAAVFESATLPSFNKFISAVSNGQADVVRGVYVPGILALRVQQQPAGRLAYVSIASGVATQFQVAADLGMTGLLAHNYAAGKSFFNLAIGAEVRVVYGDGLVKTYLVSDIYRYQALDPANPHTDLIDLNTNTQVSVADVFNTVYSGDDHVIFQTCIAKGRSPTWGRFFVVAYPE